MTGTTVTQTLTESDIETFSELSGDRNPIHLEEEAASESMFGQRVVHGMLSASVISAALAELDGEIVLLEQNLSYQDPVFPGDEVTATVEEIDRSGDVVECETNVFRDDDVVIEGTSTILQKLDN